MIKVTVLKEKVDMNVKAHMGDKVVLLYSPDKVTYMLASMGNRELAWVNADTGNQWSGTRYTSDATRETALGGFRSLTIAKEYVPYGMKPGEVDLDMPVKVGDLIVVDGKEEPVVVAQVGQGEYKLIGFHYANRYTDTVYRADTTRRDIVDSLCYGATAYKYIPSGCGRISEIILE
jgi:hypothetical protein